MEKVGILVISYGSREAAMIDVLSSSRKYETEIYVADKQLNPFNLKKAKQHVVIPDLDTDKICKFAETNRNRIRFGIVGPEKPIIDGVRDAVESRTGIPMICPTKEYAIEKSKVQQRLLFERIVPEANPRFKIFDPEQHKNTANIRKAVNSWLDELEDKVVIKPDRPAAGKGVGVWGDHFTTREQLFEHFLSNYEHGAVIIEEKIEGEESSFQAFCDGKHLLPLPDTRDYKRAFDNDMGPNTGGMGSYKDTGDILPFLDSADREREIEVADRIFENLRKEDATGLRGVPLYLAFMHTSDGVKILENNSRPGDPEIINILPILKDDFVDLCFRMIEGNLNHLEVRRVASVVTYKAPPDYGGYSNAFPDRVKRKEMDQPVDLTRAYELAEKHAQDMHIYPGSMEQRGGATFALKSRAVCVVGVGDNIEEARNISLEGVAKICGGGLWNRTDIGSRSHIGRSSAHMERLRRNK